MSPTFSVPRCTSTVATGPRPLSSLASITAPSAAAVGIGLEIEHFGLQQDGFFQLVEIDALGGGDFDRQGFAAQIFDLDFVLQQFGLHPGRIGVALVDLVDRHDHRHIRRLGVGDGFHRLGHDAVIGGHHQDDEIGDLGAARAHRGEGGMARRVEEGDLLAATSAAPDRRRYAG